MVENCSPVEDGHGPFLGNIAGGQEKQLADGLAVWESSFGFDHFANLAVVAFNGIGGIDQAADIRRIVKVGSQVFPIVFPGTDGHGILAAPLIAELDQVGFGCFPGGSLVDFFQIHHKGFAIRPGDIFQAVADLMDHTALDLGIGEHGQDSLLEPAQPIHAGDKNILHPSALQVGDHTEPEIGGFSAISDPMP